MATAAQKASPGVYVTDDIGLEVTDGSASRIQLGLLPNGSYGMQVVGANLSGSISGSPPSIVLGTAGAQLTDKGLEVSDGTNKRVTVGNIGSSYGLKVIAADGTTVIIDGSSNMFKIVASGSLSQTVANGTSGAVQDTTFGGLGTWATVPICFAGVSFSNGTFSNVRQVNREIAFADAWVASSSGGATTTHQRGITLEASVGSFLVDASTVGIRQGCSNLSGSSQTAYARYQLCQESAL
jgi:hypothetical protein